MYIDKEDYKSGFGKKCANGFLPAISEDDDIVEEIIRFVVPKVSSERERAEILLNYYYGFNSDTHWNGAILALQWLQKNKLSVPPNFYSDLKKQYEDAYALLEKLDSKQPQLV